MSNLTQRAKRIQDAAMYVLAPLMLVVASTLPASAQHNARDGSFDCLIQPKSILKIATPVPGVIREVAVDRGVVVKKGDVVASLESGVEEASVALAKARAENDTGILATRAKLGYQQRREARAKALKTTNAIPLAAADEAETAARVAEADAREASINLKLAQLELARSNELLKQRTIRTPIDGVVVSRMLGPGEYAFDQAHLVTISQIHPLHVEAYVPLSQYGRISVGSLAEVYPEGPIGGRHAATVVVVDQVFDAASGTIGVRLELPNPDYQIPAGLKCHVRFPVTQ